MSEEYKGDRLTLDILLQGAYEKRYLLSSKSSVVTVELTNCFLDIEELAKFSKEEVRKLNGNFRTFKLGYNNKNKKFYLQSN